MARNACASLFLALIMELIKSSLSSRAVPATDLYCPPEPAIGSLSFRSVDSQNSLCTPSPNDPMGNAVYTCWKSFTIEIKGCQVTMRPDETQVVGPGRLPCRFFSIAGNLTDVGVEAVMWADVDGFGLMSYYQDNMQAVEALQYDSPQQLLQDLWAFLRDFTADTRFADDSWIFGQYDDENVVTPWSGSSSSSGGGDRRLQMAFSRNAGLHEPVVMEGQVQEREEVEGTAQGEGGAANSLGDWWDRPRRGEARRRTRHGPMRVYRPSETRVVLKVPTGCKYRYTVNPGSRVFEPPTQHHTRPLQWRTIGLTVAALSVLLSVVGLGVCTYFSHKHAEYVSTYWEYQAVKDQLGSQLPAATYQKLFGEPPKSAAAAAEAAAAATAAAATNRKDKVVTFGAASAAAAAPALSPAMQQHASGVLQAEAGEAPVIGAGEPDGISSRSSSARSSEITEAADAALAAAADAPPVLGPSK